MKGRKVYEAALADADSLADVEIDGDELVGYVAMEVYEEKTGGEMPDNDVMHPALPGDGSWDFDDDAENRRRLPRVTERGG